MVRYDQNQTSDFRLCGSTTTATLPRRIQKRQSSFADAMMTFVAFLNPLPRFSFFLVAPHPHEPFLVSVSSLCLCCSIFPWGHRVPEMFFDRGVEIPRVASYINYCGEMLTQILCTHDQNSFWSISPLEHNHSTLVHCNNTTYSLCSFLCVWLTNVAVMPVTEANGKMKKLSHSPKCKLQVTAECESSGLQKKTFLTTKCDHIQLSQLRNWHHHSSCNGCASSIEGLKDKMFQCLFESKAGWSTHIHQQSCYLGMPKRFKVQEEAINDTT